MFLNLALLGLIIASEAVANDNTQSRLPLRQHDSSGATDSSIPTIFGSNGTVILKATTSTPGVVVLDYGSNVEGHPTFQVLTATGDTSRLEVTYSESLAVLNGFYMV